MRSAAPLFLEDIMSRDSLAQWQKLKDYAAGMHRMINTWKKFFHAHDIDWLSNQDIDAWFERIGITIDALGDMTAYDVMSSLHIVTQASGFPERRYIDHVVLEMENARKQKEPENFHILKKALVSMICQTKEVNIAFLEKLSKAHMREMLKTKNPLLPFHLTDIRMIETKNDRQAYVCSWEHYALQPLPVKYVMLFEISEGGLDNVDRINTLSSILREETSLICKLADLAKVIDLSLSKIHPKWIGRIILGPIFMPQMTEDDHVIQKLMNQQSSKDKNLNAGCLTYEYVISEKEDEVNRIILDSVGEKHRYLQTFSVGQDGECYERGTTHVERHLFASHCIVQRLTDDDRKDIELQIHGC